MLSVDVAVIGGGVTGLASALALAGRGASVSVLEREAKTGGATSTHNSGVIHAGLYYPTGSLKALLCVDGRNQKVADFMVDRDAINPRVIQAAGIDSPGLTCCLAIGERVAGIWKS